MVSKKHQPKATVVVHEKRVLPNGLMIERVIYQLPAPTAERPHGYKYRLYCGDSKGCCLVRYDNETGKGDHVHRQGQEYLYPFVSLTRLLADFDHDVDQVVPENPHE
jgi:hypothetical protein